MLLDRGRINRVLIRMMEGWRHSAFNVYAGPRIHPRQKRSLENPAAYLIRSSFSEQRMAYRPDEAEVTYFSKDRKEKKSYDATEWVAAMGSHVPEREQQSVRYYGAYANSTRGRERKREPDDEVPMRSSLSCLRLRRTTSPRRLPLPGSLDTACEAVLIRVPASAFVRKKPTFSLSLRTSAHHRSTGPGSFLSFHSVPHAAGHNILGLFLFDTQVPSVVLCSYAPQDSYRYSFNGKGGSLHDEQ